MSTTSTEDVIDEVAAEDEAELEALAEDAVVEEVDRGRRRGRGRRGRRGDRRRDRGGDRRRGGARGDRGGGRRGDRCRSRRRDRAAETAARPASPTWCSTPPTARSCGRGRARRLGRGRRGRGDRPRREPLRPSRVAGTSSTPTRATRTRCARTWATSWPRAGIEDRVFEVVIPMEDVVEFKGGKKVTVQKKVFPGYLLVRCDLDDDTWGAIRNTPGVTGLRGSRHQADAAVAAARWRTSCR